MIAYRNERYLHFGYFAAKTDDFANFIPARLSVILLLVATFLCKENTQSAIRIVRRDRKKHPSPNGGIPESLFAGALSIQLGGVNTYGGIISRRGLLGDPAHPLRREDIQRAIRLVRVSTYLAGVLLVVLGVFL
jgi:adenosylcobinamide-phosphate synthase